ncbi:TadE/TadG family type IV pilus assembly protein [Streptomyces cinereoruber]|uniref:TadE/TadG family type IV pilus assembly protein n=1 Tax=Streptomyces cinereoruber TaxID=67260 RepID=UPI0036336797
MSRRPRTRARATNEPRPARATNVRPQPGRACDRGQAAVEYLGFLPILLLVGLAGLQLGVAAYAAQQAGTAARAAARAASSDDEEAPSPEAAADAAVSGWIASRSSVSRGGGSGEATYTVTVEIPSVVPFWTFDDVKKTATMPMPDEEDLP